MALKLRDYLLMLGMLVTGTINTLSKKIQLQCKAPGITGIHNSSLTQDHLFKKPWLQTLLMFVGEFFCLIGFAIIRARKKRKHQQFILSGSEVPDSSLTRNSYLSWIMIIPTCCDLLGTTVAGYSLIFIDASVWQMMRGSLIVFVGILSLIFLKRVLRLFNWTGIAVTVLGLLLVGLSSVLKSKDTAGSSSEQKVIGVILVLVGSLISSTQMVLEESFLKKKGYHPLQVVGTEGFIGMVITGFIVLPILYSIPGQDNGSVENVLDGLYQIVQNPFLLVNTILYTFSIAFYNYFGLSVARSLTAVHRTLMDAMRTILVWVVNLIIFYSGSKTFGEPFDKTYGLLQIDGFAFLMIGTMIYNRVIDLDFISFCRVEDNSERSAPDASINATGEFNQPTNADDDDDDEFDEPSETDPLIREK